MNTCIFYMVNASLYFNFDGTGILVDGVHEGRREGFSPMPSAVEHDLKMHTGIFSDLRGALFTHLHDDHFDRSRLDYLQRFSGHLSVYGPELPCSNVRPDTETADFLAFPVQNVRVFSIKNIHDGDIYHSEPHRSLLLSSGTESFFVAGDAILDPSELSSYRNQLPPAVTAAFINVYQASSPSGREYLRILQPERIFLYHFPFPEDDEANYWRWGRQVARRWPSGLPKLEIPEPMHWIEGSRISQELQNII